jgi:transcriptional regulator with XRE-family HTH domain
MINRQATEASRKVLGGFLMGERQKQGVSRYRVAKESGLSQRQVMDIEEGATAYTVDALLAYVAALDCYLVVSLPPRDGRHLDTGDMLSKMT